MAATPPRSSLPLPTGRGWWLVAAGIAAGLAIFLMLWLGQRGDPELYRSDAGAPAAAAPVFQPLPAPPASGETAVEAPEIPSSAARIDEPAARPPVAGPDPGTAQEARPMAPVGASVSPPVPIESPGPRYPARALRRGESGEVLLRIHVDARGRPAQVEIASSSGSRDLDRAASNAVRRWRFRPAMQEGTPVAGVVNVPVTFDSGR